MAKNTHTINMPPELVREFRVFCAKHDIKQGDAIAKFIAFAETKESDFSQFVREGASKPANEYSLEYARQNVEAAMAFYQELLRQDDG